MEVIEFALKERDKTNPYLVPAIVYGKDMDNISLAFDRKDFRQLIKEHGRNVYLQCKLPDGKTIPSIIQEIQKDVVTFEPYHVDFLAVNSDQDVTITVPIRLVNHENCKGIKNGGKLQFVLFKTKIAGKPEQLPKEIILDIDDLDIGEVLFTRDIPLEDGIKLVSPSNLKIVGIFSRQATAEEEEEAAAEATEGVKTSEEETSTEEKSE